MKEIWRREEGREAEGGGGGGLRWVEVVAAPRVGNVGGPGPHLGIEKEDAEKGPGPGREIAEGAAQDLHTEDAPGLQDDIDPHLPPLLD